MAAGLRPTMRRVNRRGEGRGGGRHLPALFLLRERRATIVLLAVQLLLFLVPYWQAGAVERLWLRLLGY